ncbi:septal ring lytic transglycosylase RlpA family protein [Rubrobacter indicoceani]|uniref:septal ring lytic transglycosylase RlpA family protein n=1 Tax=Rubrobacter indicoceani TaxID=2051957 RepID=UPI001F09B41E|nr:septal ring lytic transglycosylase RlpA family protein [Rubrobacter indicoceani]
MTAFVANAVSAQSQQMTATWYGPGFEGATTSSGEVFDPYGYTAAHKELPFGTRLLVTYNGESVVVVINDRGPFIEGRDLDLSQGAAEAIGLIAVGEGVVDVEYVDESVPVGPYGGTAAPVVEEEPVTEQPVTETPAAEEPVGAEPARSATESPGNAAGDQYANQTDDVASDDQYSNVTEEVASDDQYSNVTEEVASDDQYDNGETLSTTTGTDGASEAVDVSVPAAGAVLTPPAELATPGSTVEKRIELAIAAPPADYAGPLPSAEAAVEAPAAEEPIAEEPIAEEPTVEEGASVESDGEIDVVYGPSSAPSVEAGLSALPDTGGVPLLPVAGAVAAMMAGASLVGMRAVMRRS